MWRQRKQIAFLIASNFAVIIHKFDSFGIYNTESFPILIAKKFSMALFFYLLTFAISVWHRKFVTTDVPAVFVKNQHCIQRHGQDFDKNVCIWRGAQQRGWQTNFPKKAGQSVIVMLISCSKSCAGHNHSWQAAMQRRSHPHFIEENNYAFVCLNILNA